LTGVVTVSQRPRVSIDESRWPVVMATWPADVMDDAEFNDMVATMSGFSKRGQPFVVVHDARRASRPTPKQRAHAAQQQKADETWTRKSLRAVALVVSSPLVAGVATAINWISPPPYPQKFFSSLAEAQAWAAEQLHRE
jgi:hypothetical protein